MSYVHIPLTVNAHVNLSRCDICFAYIDNQCAVFHQHWHERQDALNRMISDLSESRLRELLAALED